ncbi:polysaccharide pyruvyl transferase CsaB [uncultured Clostridium sp.]|nr:polysaccharide pyruvyl transferase CsaB [uncultured Clostridium sp.]
MKYIAVLDTSIMSFNIGDQIIMESARKGLAPILNDAFVVNLPTHSPMFHWWEFSFKRNDSLSQNLSKLDLKFVCGTNLLEKNMKKRKNTWNLHMMDTHYIKDVVLVGVGTDKLDKIENKYTEKLYKRILSHEYIHSTRDEKTKELLESMGFKAINTGCPTLWGLDKTVCEQIPTTKSEKVIFTITDYTPNLEKDKKMLDILFDNYKEVFCWIQGSQDVEYLQKMNLKDKNIQYISPSLAAYNEFLEREKTCDYVGTRLHGGIKAMQKLHRAIIIGVDNRAYDMHKSYNLNYISRENIEDLEDMINKPINTDIKIDINKINEFLGQFISYE